MKTIMCEMRNELTECKGRLDSAEEKISKLEDITIETVQNEMQWEEKDFAHEQSISEVWETSHSHVIGLGILTVKGRQDEQDWAELEV